MTDGTARSATGGGPPTDAELARIDAWWRAANYLSVGQIYLLDNPLLREPLRPEHVKPRLLGHWGTTPGLNFIYAHAQPGHQGARPRRDLDRRARARRAGRGRERLARGHLHARSTRTSAATSAGMRRAVPPVLVPGRHRQPRHAGDARARIHEGGELGYALVHAYGAAFDDPDLVVFCVVGDGEAETGPLAASWHSNKFVDPRRDGAVVPILHLNGYKIANPTVLARIPRRGAGGAVRGLRLPAALVEGDEPAIDAPADGGRLDEALDDIAAIQRAARAGRRRDRPAWPMIVLRSPKGWTGPEDGRRPARRGQLPLPPGAARPTSARTRSTWPCSRRGCAATGPTSCSTRTAGCDRELAGPAAERRRGA